MDTLIWLLQVFMAGIMFAVGMVIGGTVAWAARRDTKDSEERVKRIDRANALFQERMMRNAERVEDRLAKYVENTAVIAAAADAYLKDLDHVRNLYTEEVRPKTQITEEDIRKNMKLAGEQIRSGVMAMMDASRVGEIPLDQLAVAGRIAPCKGKNCGCTDSISHSPECMAEHEQALKSGSVRFGYKPTVVDLRDPLEDPFAGAGVGRT